MSRALRRRRKQARKRRQVEVQEWEEFATSLKSLGDQPLGVTREQAMELVQTGIDKMARRMVEEGGAERAPWGPVVYNLAALEKTLQTALLMMARGNEGIDQRGDALDLESDEAWRYLMQAIGGAVTAAAAAVLWLSSQPIPYDLARHVTAVENPAR